MFSAPVSTRLLAITTGLAGALGAACSSSTPVATRIPEAWTPASGGDEQPEAAMASADSPEGTFTAVGTAPGPVEWSLTNAINALAIRAARTGRLPEPAPWTASTPAEDPAAPLADGMEGLLQQTFALEGSDFDPCLSRDGTHLVFASTQHRSTPDIYIKRLGSRTVTQLTADPASDVMPAISPDGARIAFCSDRSGPWNLYVMSATGGQAVQLSTSTAHDLHPTWSPDGTRLAFCRLGQVSGRWELWVMNVAQPQSAEFIGYGMFPQWSPVPGADGCDKILFQRGRDRGDRAFSLWTIDYMPGSASNPTEVVAAASVATVGASWSPDGQWIVYSTVHTGAGTTASPGSNAHARTQRTMADLWLAAADGSSRVNLTGGRFNNLSPTWGPDQRVYFVSDRGGKDQVWSIATSKALAAAGVKPMSPAADTASAPTGE